MDDGRLYDGVRKPLPEAETLPPSCYYDKQFYERELSTIFRRKWLMIGRSDEWKSPGDYITFDRIGVPFMVVRDQAGRLRAFANSCRHRGSQVALGSGNCQSFSCPYHSWVYELDGRLRGAAGMENAQGFDKARYGLREIHLDTWLTFVFVNFAADPAPLSAQLGDLGDHLHSYDFDNVVTVGRREYVVTANWKTYVENSMEWLHHPTVHRSSIAGKVATITRNIICGDPGDYIMIQSMAKGVSRATLGSDKGFPPVSTLTGATREGSHYALLYPHAMIGCDVDSIWYKQMIPEGPDKVRNIATYCFHRELVERPDFAEIAPNYYKRFETVVEEDNRAMERQFAGLVSPLAVPGRFSDREILVHRIDNWVLDHVLA
jgi:phenylpropionate dioxygenase-like ring-hydroxylating dioxygenase large terminal subunit